MNLWTFALRIALAPGSSQVFGFWHCKNKVTKAEKMVGRRRKGPMAYLLSSYRFYRQTSFLPSQLAKADLALTRHTQADPCQAAHSAISKILDKTPIPLMTLIVIVMKIEWPWRQITAWKFSYFNSIQPYDRRKNNFGETRNYGSILIQ